MHLESTKQNDALIITVEASRIDAASAIHMKEQFRSCIETPSDRVIMDIAQVEFMDSSGLGAMVACLKLLDGKALEIACMSATVEKVFTLTRMDQVFVLHKDLPTALNDENDIDAA